MQSSHATMLLTITAVSVHQITYNNALALVSAPISAQPSPRSLLLLAPKFRVNAWQAHIC